MLRYGRGIHKDARAVPITTLSPIPIEGEQTSRKATLSKQQIDFQSRYDITPVLLRAVFRQQRSGDIDQIQTCDILGMAVCIFEQHFCTNLYQSVSDNSYRNVLRVP